MKDKLNIVYTIDDKYQQLALLCSSLNTLLKFNEVDNIYIIYWNIDIDFLKNFLYNFNDQFKVIQFINFDISLVDKYFNDIDLPNVVNKSLRYPSLARWWITYIIPCDYFWYIDTDTLFTTNIKNELIEYQNSVDLFFAFNRKDYTPRINIRFRHTNNLNAGILFINSLLYNKLILIDDILDYYKENNENIKYVNQSCYSYLFKKYNNLCHIERSEEFNIRPLYKYGQNINNQINEEYFNKVKIFHFNGPEKFLYDETYKRIMNS